MITRRNLLGAGAVSIVGSLALESQAQISSEPIDPWATELIKAAKSQIGVTRIYDPAYYGLDYPMGDIPREAGVCTDVIIRAYRDAFGVDLQVLIHTDMKRNFSAYPNSWGLKRTDRNIDHRRVPNIERFLERKKRALPLTDDPSNFQPGDIVTQRLPRNLPHIGIVTDTKSADGIRPLMVHNIGAGTRLEDRLFDFKIVGHFRAPPNALS